MKVIIFLLILTLYITSFHSHAQQVPTNTGSAVLQKDAQIALDFHNKVRADVGSPPLQWSTQVARFAQSWASKLSSDCKMEHRPAKGAWAQKYGENIFWGDGEEYTVLHASESWYSEITDYRYGPIAGKNWYKTGHYTQMVWKNTSHVGMGMAVCRNGAILIVANYNPTGNFKGEKPY